MTLVEGAELARALRAQIAKVFVGQGEVIEQVLSALLAGGHVLLEGVPGLGKTLLVKAMAQALAAKFVRIQFTPDLMPADITGHAMFDAASGKFVIRKGPLFANFVLADEINRAPAKTQAALLEVMQEGQVTIEGTPHVLPPPFLVLATQNPIEQEGTYALPEAELDRFLLKVVIDYPSHEHERLLVRTVTHGRVGDRLDVEAVERVMSSEQITALQALAARLRIDDAVVDYAVRIARATRQWPGLALGAGPRGSIALIRAARGRALLQGHEFVTPDDVKSMAHAVLRHRVILAAEAEIEGLAVDGVLNGLLAQVEAPRA